MYKGLIIKVCLNLIQRVSWIYMALQIFKFLLGHICPRSLERVKQSCIAEQACSIKYWRMFISTKTPFSSILCGVDVCDRPPRPNVLCWQLLPLSPRGTQDSPLSGDTLAVYRVALFPLTMSVWAQFPFPTPTPTFHASLGPVPSRLQQ